MKYLSLLITFFCFFSYSQNFDKRINDLIQKTIFYIEHQNYIDYTLDKEKELIQKISNNNTKQIIDLHSQINKNMHLANVVNLNKSDVLIASLKELSGI